MSSKYLCGRQMDRIPNIAFRGMSFMFVLRDFFSAPDRKIENFGICNCDTVIDYGCGTGSYLKRASQLVGAQGKIYAVDVHPLSIKKVQKRIKKLNLKNVVPVLSDGYACSIDDHVADVVYALDMFHMVGNPDQFLKELNRLIKPQGRLILEDGHQPREQTTEKVNKSRVWEIIEEHEKHLVCFPALND